jgi:hypothetical protein
MKKSVVLIIVPLIFIASLAWAETAKKLETTKSTKAKLSKDQYELLIKSSKEENECALWNNWKNRT